MPPPRAHTARVPTLIGSSFSRSYGCNLPSSLTIVLPIASVFSTYPPVSVWGTGGVSTHCWDFLGSIGSVTSSESTRHHASVLNDPNSHRDPPTRLPGDYHRSGSPTFLRPPSVTRNQIIRIDTRSASESQNIGLDVYTPVLEYQPVVHRLRLAASP